MTQNKVSKHYRLHPQDIDQIKQLSEQLGVSQTSFVERALHRYINDLANDKPA